MPFAGGCFALFNGPVLRPFEGCARRGGGAAQVRSAKTTKGHPKVTFIVSPEREIGAGEAIRTPDPNLGKVMLYP